MQFRSDRSRLDANIALAFTRAQLECVGQAQEDAPVSVSRGMKLNAGDVQGGLRASITAETPRKVGGDWFSRFGSALRYAMQREFGGVILPVRKKVLSWQDPETGEWHFAKRVAQLPGGKRQGNKPWLRPAGDRFPEFMEDHLRSLG